MLKYLLFCYKILDDYINVMIRLNIPFQDLAQEQVDEKAGANAFMNGTGGEPQQAGQLSVLPFDTDERVRDLAIAAFALLTPQRSPCRAHANADFL